MVPQLKNFKLTTPPIHLYHYDDIRNVHLELTHRCNAACPMCARNLSGGGVNPSLPLVELSLTDVKKILKPEFVSQLKRIYACGNYGDPMVARDCLEIFRYLRDCNSELNLCMHSNGSARRPEWWRELAKVMSKGPHYLRFGIDGLADTNHIYRRGTQWDNVMRSAQTFIDSGGRAEWDFLVFRHNEHQVKQAQKLAQEMGFAEFFVRKTGRFATDGKLETSDRFKVLDGHGRFDYWLEQPTINSFVNPAFDELADIKKKHGSYQLYLDEVPIHCKVAGKKRKIYISAEGLALPCCWLGATFSEAGNPERQQFLQLIQDNGGKQSLDARRRGLKAVIESPLFQRDIPSSWQRDSVAAGKLAICARTCGIEFDPLGHQRD